MGDALLDSLLLQKLQLIFKVQLLLKFLCRCGNDRNLVAVEKAIGADEDCYGSVERIAVPVAAAAAVPHSAAVDPAVAS
nr:hypothetical protein Iba_chr11eCG15410 [Ipomoea batatas]